DPYTAGHQRRVSELSRTIAQEMGLPTEKINGLRMAAMIHDLGKINIPIEILIKPTRLSDIEFSLIKVHAEVGYGILKDIDFPWPVARMVLEHHERMNGSGYPNRLTGENLLIESRIMAVADVVEAIATYRPYRPALGIEKALEEVSQNKGILYDPEAVDACLRLFKEKGYKLE
ncbi:MAG: HD domain-containing phosphohydrolase, partial [Thermodesulfobacteriota bacterium]